MQLPWPRDRVDVVGNSGGNDRGRSGVGRATRWRLARLYTFFPHRPQGFALPLMAPFLLEAHNPVLLCLVCGLRSLHKTSVQSTMQRLDPSAHA